MRRVAWVLAGLALAAGVWVLRAEVMTVHGEPPGARTDIVVVAATREDPRLLPEMTRSLVSVCRTLVNADVLEKSFNQVEDGVFTFSLEPALGEFDRREMLGCLQDTRVQHLLLDVTSVETVLEDA